MSYQLCFSLNLGLSNINLTLRARLVDTDGINYGSEISTGFSEIGKGFYLWNYSSIPDDFRGGVKFYTNGDSSNIVSFIAINPEEAEYVNESLSESRTNISVGAETNNVEIRKGSS